jgi:predicted component of type VI protein secretion system
VAIGRGSLSLLRVLLVEAGVDACGLVLFDNGGPAAPAKRADLRGALRSRDTLKALQFDVQQSKEALKALLARGALLGRHAPPSKLLRKLEEDGNSLWNARALDGLTKAHPEIPEVVVERLQAFL